MVTLSASFLGHFLKFIDPHVMLMFSIELQTLNAAFSGDSLMKLNH